MIKKFLHSKYAFPIAAVLVFVIAFNFDEIGAGLTGFFSSKKPPLLKLDGATVDVSACQYLGSWQVPDEIVQGGTGKSKGRGARSWKDTVRLSYDDDRKVFKINAYAPKLNGSIPRQLTPGSEEGAFKKITWRSNQVSVFAFRALSPKKQVAIVEIDTDNTIALYVNDKLAGEVSATAAVELGANVLIPVALDAGENVFTARVLSNDGPPRLRMGLVLDQSKDFQAACNRSWGFLSKRICNQTGNTFESPVVKWDALLSRMSIGVGIYDVLNGRNLFQMDAVRNGNVIRDRGRVLGEGIYKITYKSRQSGQETFEEHFLVGDPRRMVDALTGQLEKLPWSAAEKLNVEAQLRRAEILFRKANYKPGDKTWEEKVLYTIGNLAEFVNLKKSVAQAASGSTEIPLGRRREAPPKPPSGNLALPENSALPEAATDIFKDMTGLRLRGFVSKIDNSKQFYRLYVPTTHKAGEKLPLLVIMPTTMSLNPSARPFLEGPYVASHREAVQACAFAEKYGFAVLWAGYRSPPMWWTYEAVHAEEAIEDVEKYYNVDSSMISVYGTCAGGFLAARLVTTYPNRFAAIVYDRAIFERDPRTFGKPDDKTDEWIRAINPSGKIIANKNIKIIVLNDGTRSPQHGAIALSREFVKRAQAARSDVIYDLGQRKIGVGLWNSVFGYLGKCRNEHPDRVKADVPAASGYAGPISEVFATPFIVVKGTHTNPDEAGFMNKAIIDLKAHYRAQFYSARFVVKNDTEITDEDMGKHSLVLLGNAECNAVWGRLAAKYAGGMTPYAPPDDWPAASTESAFAEVFKNPANKEIYLLLIGADKLENMGFLKDFNPFKAAFDSYIYKYRAGREREFITARRP